VLHPRQRRGICTFRLISEIQRPADIAGWAGFRISNLIPVTVSKTRKLAYFALILAALIWGIAPPVIKYTLNFISPVSFLFFRFLVSSLIVIIPLVWRVKKIKPAATDWLVYFFLGFLCTPLNLLLLFWGINKTSAIDASLISITSPIFTTIGGILFLQENTSKKKFIGLTVAITGTTLTIFQPLLESKTNFFAHLEGNFLVLLGTLVWVIFVILAKKYRHLDPFILSSFSFIIGLIIFFPLVSISHFSLTPSLLSALPGVLFMAIFSSVIAYFTHIYGLSKIEASEAEIFTYLQPIFAIPVSIIFLKETITLPFILGALLIAVGVVICEYRQKI